MIRDARGGSLFGSVSVVVRRRRRQCARRDDDDDDDDDDGSVGRSVIYLRVRDVRGCVVSLCVVRDGCANERTNAGIL